jgi:hypothetical protein
LCSSIWCSWSGLSRTKTRTVFLLDVGILGLGMFCTPVFAIGIDGLFFYIQRDCLESLPGDWTFFQPDHHRADSRRALYGWYNMKWVNDCQNGMGTREKRWQ